MTDPRSNTALTDRERALVEGSDEGLEALMDSDAVIVDWRGEFDEICDDFARRLPPDYLAMEEDGDELMVSSPHAVATVPLDGEPPFGLDLAAGIAAILPPEFEARAFRVSLESDTHCYLVRPRAWWDAFRVQHAARYSAIFADPAELPERFEVSSDDD